MLRLIRITLILLTVPLPAMALSPEDARHLLARRKRQSPFLGSLVHARWSHQALLRFGTARLDAKDR
jgi:hypothetical protein